MSNHHQCRRARGRTAKGHVGDVHARSTQDRADNPNHSRSIVVANQQHVPTRRDVDSVVVDHHQPSVTSHQRARNPRCAPAQGDQVRVLAARCQPLLADLDPGRLRHLGRVHITHRLAGTCAKKALQRRQRQDACVVVGQRALVHNIERAGLVGGDRGKQAPEPFCKRQVGPHRL